MSYLQESETQSKSTVESLKLHKVETVALEGHTATDIHGHSLIAIDEKAEAALRWKLDLHILPVVAMLYLFCARLAGLEHDLQMTGKYDYNILLSSVYIAFVLCEVPSNYLCKVIGPAIFIPALSFGFGAFSLAMAFVTTFKGGIVIRSMLGVFEAGVFPGIAYYLSRWYRKDELGFRLALYIVFAPLAGAFGGLFASALLMIPKFGMVTSWRMIFFVEGLMTMILAAIALFLLSDRPDTAKWLTPEERALCAARSKSENVGAVVVVDELKNKVFMSGMFNTTSIVVAVIFLLTNITVHSLSFFLPTIVKTIFTNMTVIQLQLMTVPVYVAGAIMSLVLPYLSWKTGRRAVWMSIAAPLMIIGYAIFVATNNPSARYVGCFFIASGTFALISFSNTWSAINTTSDTARAGAIAMTVFGGNIGGVAATWSFLPQYAPHQLPGNALNLGTSTLLLLLTLGLWAWQTRQNKLRDEGHMDYLLEGKTKEEIAVMGTRHPGFRFRT
ncbi:BQ2448_7090 [Microbotryum intermedium]|uniref:BQ2448_7090 protein n=1 Tax=Microbotryum intermedium TaxID=269621 RepID=A0A238FJ36_9BASI|nr:BQ2448_7090 [Microbotryum intermedium]